VHTTELIPLADYASPAMPTEHAFRTAWQRLRHRVAGDGDDGPLLPSARLARSSMQLLDDLTELPACAPLLRALEEQLGGWARSRDASPRVQLIVLPPCDQTGTLDAWARAAGHAVLDAPTRQALLGPDAHELAGELAGDGLLVIPRLEQWFVRQHRGLRAVRGLLAGLAASPRRCLVGCNSWAWRYLVKAVDADLMLPRPSAFEAFDAARLRQWFADPTTVGADGATFRLAHSGADVLACNEGGEPHSTWLRLLAARSGGIPWVAWHLWRASLQLRAEDTTLSQRAAQAVANDQRTIWVVEHADPPLPSAHEDRALLALQALLLHGGLTARELNDVLPSTGETDLLPALMASGHLRCDGGVYSVRPTAYPAVRQALRVADFPMGAM
jgi:hypothetical protein